MNSHVLGHINRRKSWLIWLILISLLLLAYVLRLHGLDAFSFWTDEGLTPLRSGYSLGKILSNEIIIQDAVTKDTHPPLYYLILHFSQRSFGQSDFAYRYPSLIAGMLLIPLLFQFGRRLHSPLLGLIAALLTAVNPLQIWYAREARMYTLLVLLAAAASYVLWRAMTRKDLSTSGLRRYLTLYLLLAALTVYTHYTAVLLIAGQSMFLVWLLWQGGQRRLLIGAAIAGALLVIPLIPFTIPRLFTGAEANYFYVSPLIMLQDVINGFGYGVTLHFEMVSVKLLTAGTAVLIFVGFYAACHWQHRLFQFVYLLAAVFGLMAGSLIKPMYQGVRHTMAGSPALLLLAAWGIVWLVTRAMQAKPFWLTLIWSGLSLSALGMLLGGAIVALDNLHHDDRFVKDAYQELIQYVEQTAGDHDVILYNDAILLPLHEHYRTRQDIAAAASPVYPYTSAHSPEQLATLAEQYDRIWFVTGLPADGRDDEMVVRQWLDTNLTLVSARNFPGRSTEVRVITYVTAPPVKLFLPEDAVGLDIEWAGLPPLRGLQLNFTQPTSLPALWLDLFWENNPFNAASTQLRFSLRGPDDKEWLIRHQSLVLEEAVPETTGPRPDDAVVSISYALPIPYGTPPGIYTLFLQPFGSADGPPLGDAQPLAQVTLTTSNSRGVSPKLSPLIALHFQNGLTLKGIIFPDTEVRPGHNLPLTLFWEADLPLQANGLRYELAILGPDGEVLKKQEGVPGADWLTTWPPGVPIVEYSGLYFPPDTKPGRYRLRWRLVGDGDSGRTGRPAWRPWPSEYNMLGAITVKPWPLVTDLPDHANLIQASFGPAVQLYGYELEQGGEALMVTLYWQAQAVPDNDYFSFIHLVSEEGEIVAQQAFIPVNGLRPTRGWRPDEVLTDAYTLDLPPDLPPGEYSLIAGLFDPETDERPSVIYQGQPQERNQIKLTTVLLP